MTSPFDTPKFSHLDSQGSAKMIDVGSKPDQKRTASAWCEVHCHPDTIEALRNSALPKGDVLTVARIAAIQAAKRTDELIPLCHSLPLSSVHVEFKVEPDRICIEATASTTAKTGVEMEALTAASIAALTIYDMCKAVDKAMVINSLKVIKKTKE